MAKFEGVWSEHSTWLVGVFEALDALKLSETHVHISEEGVAFHSHWSYGWWVTLRLARDGFETFHLPDRVRARFAGHLLEVPLARLLEYLTSREVGPLQIVQPGSTLSLGAPTRTPGPWTYLELVAPIEGQLGDRLSKMFLDPQYAADWRYQVEFLCDPREFRCGVAAAVRRCETLPAPTHDVYDGVLQASIEESALWAYPAREGYGVKDARQDLAPIRARDLRVRWNPSHAVRDLSNADCLGYFEITRPLLRILDVVQSRLDCEECTVRMVFIPPLSPQDWSDVVIRDDAWQLPNPILWIRFAVAPHASLEFTIPSLAFPHYIMRVKKTTDTKDWIAAYEKKGLL